MDKLVENFVVNQTIDKYIYDRDRTICDVLRYMNRMDREIFNSAIQGYVKDQKKNIPILGSEQGGTRPVLIISNDVGNRFSPTVIIAPITSRVHGKSKLPTHTIIRDFEGLGKVSIILSEQIRTIDKQRLGEYYLKKQP